MNSPTNQSLKQTLAKMLPEKITIYKGEAFVSAWHHEGYRSVLDTELLQICQDVENKLTAQDHFLFRERIRATTSSNREEYSPSWQQRTIALAAVKQIEII